MCGLSSRPTSIQEGQDEVLAVGRNTSQDNWRVARGLESIYFEALRNEILVRLSLHVLLGVRGLLVRQALSQRLAIFMLRVSKHEAEVDVDDLHEGFVWEKFVHGPDSISMFGFGGDQ